MAKKELNSEKTCVLLCWFCTCAYKICYVLFHNNSHFYCCHFRFLDVSEFINKYLFFTKESDKKTQLRANSTYSLIRIRRKKRAEQKGNRSLIRFNCNWTRSFDFASKIYNIYTWICLKEFDFVCLLALWAHIFHLKTGW